MSVHTNPITTEIIRNAFNAIAEDMNAALIRSAYTPLIYEGKDCAVGLLDENGEVLGQSLGVPLFLGNLSLCVQLTAELKGWDFFGEGDVVILNDAYIAGTHLNDVTVIRPIFWQGKRIGFSTSRAHWLDVGAKDANLSTDSYEIYQEGMRWGPTKVYEGGTPREDILDFLKRNSRFGEALIGDLHAQIAAGKTGEDRMNSLVDRFGYETVKAARDDIFRQSEEMERQTVRAIPDGLYKSEGVLDNDGLGSDSIPVKLQITVNGDSVTLDLEGSAAQTKGSINCGFTQTISAARMAFKMFVNPERPVDGGTFHTLTVNAPTGSIFYAQEPAACGWYFSPLGLLMDLFSKALAPVLPDQAAAAHYGDSMVVFLTGFDDRNNGARYLLVEANTGGWGAWCSSDGEDALINKSSGSYRDLPIEILEHKYPVRIMRYGIRTDSGGPGKYRGGNGIFREYHLTSDSNMSLWFERSKSPAWGINGGDAGKGPDVTIIYDDGTEEKVLKSNATPIKAGTIILAKTGGGGGYGNAEERDAELVAADIANHHVSADFAETVYPSLKS